MEFEQYLEKDIITFLEGKIEKKDNVVIDREEEYGVYLKRDYLKEMSYALDNDEITKAKRLFDELKAAFANIPKNSIERKKTYSLLEKMYDKIQNYAKIKEGKIEVIKQGESEVFKDTTEKFQDITQRVAQNETQVPDAETDADLPISSKGKKNDEKKTDDYGQSIMQAKSGILEKSVEKVKKDDSGAIQKYESYAKEIINPEEIVGKMNPENPDAWTGDILAYIDHNTKQLARLKTLVIKKLLEDLRRKLDDASDENERRIEALKKELIDTMTKELDKRASSEPKISEDKVRDEIIDKVYKKARHLVSISDADHIDSIKGDAWVREIPVIEEKAPEATAKKEDAAERFMIPDHVDKRDVIRYEMPSTEPLGSGASEYKEIGDEYIEADFQEIKVPLKQAHKSQASDEKINSMYEEAIYTMFQNDYAGAARILEDIIRVRPQAKAARIRLQECLEAIGDG